MSNERVSVRQADASDAIFLRKMIWKALLASPNLFEQMGEDAIRRHEDRYWESWTPESDPAFVAHDENGTALGALVLYRNRGGADEPSWRIGMAVEEEAQGKGVGKILIRCSLLYARSEGGRYVNLLVDRDNERAINLYRRMGFSDVGANGTTVEMKITLA